MPPRPKFTKQEIVAAGLKVARERGIEAVSTRDIAAVLGVSTRPIFTYFRSMDELKAEVYQEAEEIYRGYVQEGLKEKVPFLGVGMQYIRFAKEEPQLYRMLFLSPPVKGYSNVMGQLENSQAMLRESIRQIYHMDDMAADQYFRDMWLVVHSLATLTVTGSAPYTEEEMGSILTEFSVSICKAYKEIPGFFEGKFDKDAVFRELVSK